VGAVIGTLEVDSTGGEEPGVVELGGGTVDDGDGTVVGELVVVVGAVPQLSAVVTYGAATRPRASPLAMNTALVSICPHLICTDRTAVRVLAGMTPTSSLGVSPLEEIPTWARTAIGMATGTGASRP
jgi:hypothetical protein